MDKFLLDLFRTPESQRDAYVWGCVFGSHLAFGMSAWVFAMYFSDNPEVATKISVLSYFCWEVAQFLMKRTFSIFLDCVVDLVAWASMAFALYEIWFHNVGNASAYAFGSITIMIVGVYKRVRSHDG